MITSTNPATGEILKTYTSLDDEGLETRLAQAASAFTHWRTTDLAVRVQLVYDLADTLEQSAQTSAVLMSQEMGKTIDAGQAEIEKCVSYCRYTADNAHIYLADEPIETHYARSFTRPCPLGTILLVMPWNFPYWQVIRVAVAVILAGNTCLLKHASNVPGCALSLENMFTKAGFPKGVFQTLLIGSAMVDAVLRDSRIMGASVTGSERAGSAVAATCGELIKPCVLELGGADPFIVMPSADLQAAIDHAITGRMRNNGQSCIAAKRLIVHADIYEDFKKGFMAQINNINIGDPSHQDTDMGPLASAQALNDHKDLLNTAIKQGAQATFGAQSLPKVGSFINAGILENVTKDMDIYAQEVFAPIAMLFQVDNLSQAITLANDTPLGLSSVLFSNDKTEHAHAIAALDAGSTYINRYASSDIHLPFGGTKKSGFGREMAKQGLREFTNLKTIIVAD